MNPIRSTWLRAALAVADTDENAQAVAEALTEAMTGLSPIARTDWRALSRRTGLGRREVFDTIEDLIVAGLIQPGRFAGGFKLTMPEAVAE